MTDLPNSEAQAKAALYAAMRRGTDPRWATASPVDEVQPSRIGWMIWPALVLGLAVCVAIASI